MKAEYINPFIASLQNVCKTMLHCDIKRGALKVVDINKQVECVASKDNTIQTQMTAAPTGRSIPVTTMQNDIVSFIGLTGRARGTVALFFPAKTALMVARTMLEMPDLRPRDSMVTDAVSEMVNMVAGGAKAQFVDGGNEPIRLSLPTVVRGSNFQIEYPTGVVWLEVPFSSKLGPLSMQVSFEM